MAKKTSNGRRDNRTGAIYKDGDGYRVQILLRYDPTTGKPVYKKARAKTHDLAIDALARLQHSARLQPLATPSGQTLAQYVQHWLETRIEPTRAPKTAQQYRWILSQHVIPTLGKKRVDHVTRADVQALVRALSRQKVKPRSKEPTEADMKDLPLLSARTVSLSVTVLHALYESAIREGIATMNPATYIDLPRASTKPAQFLDPKQVASLVEHLSDSPIRELALFMLATGTRLGEATGMRWTDLDLDLGFARIAGQLQRIDGKLTYRPSTKTNRDRTLPLAPWMVDELKNMKSRQLVLGQSDPEGIAFLNPLGRRLDPKYVSNQLESACEKAKVPVVSPHKLRHTAATLALMESGDLHAVQKLLGHQQVALTANLYGHATAERLRPVTDALGKLLKPHTGY